MDESSEKTEEATPQKLRDARDKGMALRSQELSVLISLVVMAATIMLLIPPAARGLMNASHAWIVAVGDGAAIASTPPPDGLTLPGLNLLLAIFVISAILLTVAAAAYGGIQFSGFPLKPDFSRINPAKGLKRIFSMHTLAETAKATLKTVALLALIWFLAKSVLSEMAVYRASGTFHAAALLSELALRAVLWLIGLQLLFALFDLWYANRRYRQQLRMSKQDLKDEYKRQEGDPETRRKRKQIASALMSQIKALGSVKDSDVVVTNPTRVAVALKYLPATMDAPIIACSGRGGMALLIRALARRHGVPVVRQPPLARGLAREYRIGEQIGKEHQPAVVFIYRWLLARPDNRIRLASR